MATKSLLFLSSSIYVGVIFNTSVVLHSYLACLIFGSSFLIAAGWNGNDACVRVGQNSIYTPYMTVYLVISLPKTYAIPHVHMSQAISTFVCGSPPRWKDSRSSQASVQLALNTQIDLSHSALACCSTAFTLGTCVLQHSLHTRHMCAAAQCSHSARVCLGSPVL